MVVGLWLCRRPTYPCPCFKSAASATTNPGRKTMYLLEISSRGFYKRAFCNSVPDVRARDSLWCLNFSQPVSHKAALRREAEHRRELLRGRETPFRPFNSACFQVLETVEISSTRLLQARLGGQHTSENFQAKQKHKVPPSCTRAAPSDASDI
jgi:hypothetical protein